MTPAERWRALTAADLRAVGLPMAARQPGEAGILVTVDGEVYRSAAGPPREIATDVERIRLGIICGDAPDGSVMTHTAPSGSCRSWVKREGQWSVV